MTLPPPPPPGRHPVAPPHMTDAHVQVAAAPMPAKGSSATSVIGNILWVVLAGFWLSLAYVAAGVVNMLTIIGIPFGIQSFKLAGYALWPFGRVVVQRNDRDTGLSCVGNVLWFVLGGIWIAIGHLVLGLVLCVTIVGIPLGLGSIKMAGLAIAPFGKQIVSKNRLQALPGVVVVSQIR